MTEELGELARAIRKNIGVKIDNKEKIYAMEEELADIQNYLFHLSKYSGYKFGRSILEKRSRKRNEKVEIA